MQERRSLLYIDKDDIPKSAVAWGVDTEQSPQGNVLYIPLYKINLVTLNGYTFDFPKGYQYDQGVLRIIGVEHSPSSGSIRIGGGTGTDIHSYLWESYDTQDMTNTTDIMYIYRSGLYSKTSLNIFKQEDNTDSDNYMCFLEPAPFYKSDGQYSFNNIQNGWGRSLNAYIKILFSRPVYLKRGGLYLNYGNSDYQRLQTPYPYPIYIDTETY